MITSNNLKFSIKFVKFLELVVDTFIYVQKINMDFYVNIRWKNGMLMNSLIPWS
jgi:hypothetical protein